MANYSSSSPSKRTGTSTSSGSFTGFVGLVVVGFSIWALVRIARMALSVAAVALDVVLGVAPDDVVSNVALSAIGGFCAGVAVAILGSLQLKRDTVQKSFVSALFSNGLTGPSLDGIFWTKVAVSGTVGLLVGTLTGASGFLSFPQAMIGQGNVFSGNAFPIVALLGGAFGGPGGTDFWSLVFLALLVVVMAVVIGSMAGLVLHAAISAMIGGATKATTKEWVLQALEEIPANQNQDHKRHPIRDGVIRGFITGGLVGLIEAACTIWGVIAFYHPPHS